jgi:hypothetical protein
VLIVGNFIFFRSEPLLIASMSGPTFGNINVSGSSLLLGIYYYIL